MAQRRCPNCGEYVPSNSLTCPKCFAEVPREEGYGEMREYGGGEKRREREPGTKNMTLVKILASIPVFFGILGLGQIYLEPTRSKGYWFLVIGALLFATFLVLLKSMLDSGIFSAIFLFITMVVVLLIYLSAAAAAFLDAIFGSVFKVVKF